MGDMIDGGDRLGADAGVTKGTCTVEKIGYAG